MRYHKKMGYNMTNIDHASPIPTPIVMDVPRYTVLDKKMLGRGPRTEKIDTLEYMNIPRIGPSCLLPMWHNALGPLGQGF